MYGRWAFALFLLTLYLVRVFYLNAFHIVTYGLGIYLLNLFIGFLSPQVRWPLCISLYLLMLLLLDDLTCALGCL